MYYDHGIAFHTSSNTKTAGDILYDFGNSGLVSSGTAERMTITPDGNVGIGTSSPAVQLNVGHESHGVGIAYTSSLPNSAGIYTSSDGAHGQAYGSLIVQARADYSGYGICFRASNAERMRIDGNGNLLVGTTSNKGEGVTSKKGFGIRSTNSGSGGIQEYCRTYNGTTTYQNIITKAGASVQGFAEVTIYTAYGTPTFAAGILRLMVLPNGTVSVLSTEGEDGVGTSAIQYQWSGDNFQVKTDNTSVYFTCHIKLIDTNNQWPQQS
jgi:hypothetical protein